MKVSELRKTLKDCIKSLKDETYDADQSFETALELLSEDDEASARFLTEDCTAEEYVCIAEILEDIIEAMPSREFLQAYKKLMKKFPGEAAEGNISEKIEMAEEVLELVGEFED